MQLVFFTFDQLFFAIDVLTVSVHIQYSSSFYRRKNNCKVDFVDKLDSFQVLYTVANYYHPSTANIYSLPYVIGSTRSYI